MLLLLALLFSCQVAAQQPASRPNILWITSEDMGPHLGAYGDSYAVTPELDQLASRGMIYRNAWSTAPVCAPARTTLISGLYPPSTGSQHMRSNTRLPASMKMYPQYMRAAGYYCTNNSKEDYNLIKPGQVWDESSREAHWRNRRPGQPFFAIFNFTISHESRIRDQPHELKHDPAEARVPAYHPDTPEVRRDWAQYYDRITEMDELAGGVLRELEQAGLAEETIIFYYADHGSGMPRNKRWTFNSGLNVPLIVYFPEKYRHLAPSDYRPGGETERLVGFIDLAPTLLSVAGIQPPVHFQGHAFAGKYEAPEQPYIYGFRGRMDERYDMVRTVRDKRYIYIRNYKPHKIYGQFIEYMFRTPTTSVWRELYDAGKLSPPRTFFWETKPPEELYDLSADRDEVNNLAKSPVYQKVLRRMRKAQRALAVRIRDVGFLPEGEIHSRSEGSTPYEMGHDDFRYPMKRVMAMAEAASSLTPEDFPKIQKGFKAGDSAVRYWAAMGALMRGQDAVRAAADELRRVLQDDSPYVRATAAQALGQYGSDAEARNALKVLMALAPLDKNGLFVSIAALNAIDAMDGRAASAEAAIAALPTEDSSVHRRLRAYVPNLIKKILADLD